MSRASKSSQNQIEVVYVDNNESYEKNGQGATSVSEVPPQQEIT